MTSTEIDYSRKWYVMTAVGLGIFLATIDGSIVNIALPTLAGAFNVPFSTLEWVVLAYLLTVTSLMLGVGRLADIRGKKSIYTAGFVVFTLGSVLCGLAPTIEALIFFRVVQAMGAAMTMSLGTAIITEAFPHAERGRAIGIAGAIVSVGIAIGPTLGGLILESFSWRWIFYVNLPIGIVGTYMAVRYVQAHKPKGGQRFDLPGAALLFLALLALLLAFTLAQTHGFGDSLVLGLLASWLVFQVIFVVVELRTSQPMIDLRLFRQPLFTVNLVTAVMVFFCLAGMQILMPFYVQDILGYSPQAAGLLLVTVPVALGIFSPISGTLSDRFGTRTITITGLVIMVAGFLGLTALSEDTSSLGYILHFLPIGIGMGIFQSPNNSAIMGSVSREQLGIASGMLAVSRTLGQIMGIAVMGTVWASIVFQRAGGILPGGATSAPVAYQVSGLRDTFLIMTGVLFLGLVFALFAAWRERRIFKGA